MATTMTVYVRHAPDGTIEGIHLNGAAFEQEVDWRCDLLSQADPRFLAHDAAAGTVTLRADEGVATYRVVERDPWRDVLKTTLEHVEAA